eukprot:scaffold19.g1787.t1
MQPSHAATCDEEQLDADWTLPAAGAATAGADCSLAGASGMLRRPLKELDNHRQGKDGQLAQLEGANQQLRSRLQEVLGELQGAQQQLAILRGLQQEWQDGTPDAAALDEALERFETRFAEARAEAMQRGEALEAAQQQLAASQVRARELVAVKQAVQRQLEQQAAAAADAAAEAERLRAQLETTAPLRADAEQLRSQVAEAHVQLGQAQAEVQTLSETVEAAGEAVHGLQAVLAEREGELAQREDECAALQRRIAGMLGVEPSEVPAMTGLAIRGMAPDDGTVMGRLARLEAANERLEQALVDARQGGAEDDDDLVVSLTEQLAHARGRLEAAEEHLRELEGSARASAAAALRAEAALQESLRERALLEEQGLDAQLQADEARGMVSVLESSELRLREQLAAARDEVGELERRCIEQEQELKSVRAAAAGPRREAAVQTVQPNLADAETSAAEERQLGAEAGVQADLAGPPDANAVDWRADGVTVEGSGRQWSRSGELRTSQQQQQQVLELTSQLAEARLAEVSQKQECARLAVQLASAESELATLKSQLAAAEQRAAAAEEAAGRQVVKARQEAEEARQLVGAARQSADAAMQDADAARQKVAELRARCEVLDLERAELCELRSACYAVIHRCRQAAAGWRAAASLGGDIPAAGEISQLPEQLRQAAGEVLAPLEEREASIAHLQQHLRDPGREPVRQAPVLSKVVAAGGSAAEVDVEAAAAVPLESSQRAVIRSLSLQVGSLRRQLATAARQRNQLQERLRTLRASLGRSSMDDIDEPAEEGAGEEGEACVLSVSAAADVGPEGSGDSRQLLGMFPLLSQHLAVLQRVQEQLGAGTAPTSSGAGSARAPPTKDSLLAAAQQQVSHSAAVLASELPALQATVQVMLAEARQLAQSTATRPRADASPAAAPLLCLPAPPSPPVPAPTTHQPGEEQVNKLRQRKDKWKRRCQATETEAKEVAAAAEREQAELQATIRALESNAAEQTERRIAEAEALRGQLEQAAEARGQLEATLQAFSTQLEEAGATIEALQQELQRQAAEREGGEAVLRRQLGDAQAALEEEARARAALQATLDEVAAGLESGQSSEKSLRAQVVELGQRVVVLRAAQEAAAAEVEQKQAAESAAQEELASVREAYTELAAEKEEREGALLMRLQEVQHECEALLAAVEGAEEQRQALEAGLGARLDALAAQLGHAAALEPAGLAEVAASLVGLASAAERFDVRLLRLEAQAAVILKDKEAAGMAQWARLARSQRYRTAVKHLRDSLQRQLLDCQAARHQQAAEVARLQAALAAAEAECCRLEQQLHDTHARHVHELQAASELMASHAAAAGQRLEDQRGEAEQRAQALAAAAAAAAEQRSQAQAAARVGEVEAVTRREVEAAEAARRGVEAELAAAREEFGRYQALKAVEVKLLEQRVLRSLQNGSSVGSAGAAGPAGKPASRQPAPGSRGVQQPAGALAPAPSSGLLAAAERGECELTSAAEIEAVCAAEGIAAALREARIEALQREQVERQLAAAQQEAEQLRARAKAAEQELSGLRGRLGGDARAARERCEALEAELAGCQQALRVAKAEGARRLRELQDLQRQVASAADGGPGGDGPTAALEAEREARDAAEAQLREARQSLARKTALAKELRAKLDEAEAQLRQQDPAPLLAELEASQARCRHLSSTCGMREAALRELRQRLELQRSQLAAAEEQQQQQDGRVAAQASRLQREAAQKDAQLAGLQQQLHEVHAELAAAAAGLQQAAAAQQRVEHAASAALEARAASMRQLGAGIGQLLQLAQGLARQLAAALSAAAEARRAETAAESSSGMPVGPSAADDPLLVARITGLPSEDVRALLEPSGWGSGEQRQQHSQAVAQLSALQAELRQAEDQACALGTDQDAEGDPDGVAHRLALAVASLCSRASHLPALRPEGWGSEDAAAPWLGGDGAMAQLEERLQAAAREDEAQLRLCDALALCVVLREALPPDAAAALAAHLPSVQTLGLGLLSEAGEQLLELRLLEQRGVPAGPLEPAVELGQGTAAWAAFRQARPLVWRASQGASPPHEDWRQLLEAHPGGVALATSPLQARPAAPSWRFATPCTATAPPAPVPSVLHALTWVASCLTCAQALGEPPMGSATFVVEQEPSPAASHTRPSTCGRRERALPPAATPPSRCHVSLGFLNRVMPRRVIARMASAALTLDQAAAPAIPGPAAAVAAALASARAAGRGGAGRPAPAQPLSRAGSEGDGGPWPGTPSAADANAGSRAPAEAVEAEARRPLLQVAVPAPGSVPPTPQSTPAVPGASPRAPALPPLLLSSALVGTEKKFNLEFKDSLLEDAFATHFNSMQTSADVGIYRTYSLLLAGVLVGMWLTGGLWSSGVFPFVQALLSVAVPYALISRRPAWFVAQRAIVVAALRISSAVLLLAHFYMSPGFYSGGLLRALTGTLSLSMAVNTFRFRLRFKSGLLVQLVKLYLCAATDAYIYSDPRRAALQYLGLTTALATQLCAARARREFVATRWPALQRRLLEEAAARAFVPAVHLPKSQLSHSGSSTFLPSSCSGSCGPCTPTSAAGPSNADAGATRQG